MTASPVEIPNEILFPEIERLLSDGKEVVLLTKGNSMLPTIWGERDSVRLEKSESYIKGDVVLAKLPNEQYVLHRILSTDSGKVILKGDGNLRGTESCRLEDICGKAVAVSRGEKEHPVGQATVWNKLPRICKRVILSILVRL